MKRPKKLETPCVACGSTQDHPTRIRIICPLCLQGPLCPDCQPKHVCPKKETA